MSEPGAPREAARSLLERLGRWNLKRLGAKSRTDAVVVAGGPEHGGAEGQPIATALHSFVFDRHPDAAPTAPPLVLMHGVGSSATTFAKLLKRLRPHVGPVYLPEAPAHGESETPAAPLTPEVLFRIVRQWLDTVPEAPFVLYGNSLGGAAAIRYAIERPERVAALLLLSPAGAHGEDGELEALVSTFDLKSGSDARRFMGRLFERPRWYHAVAGNELRRRFALKPLREFFAKAGAEDLLDAERVAGLPMPVLLMWGGAEKLLPDSHRRWFKAHLPRTASLSEPPHFAHSAYIEHADEVAAMVLAFLRERGVA